MKTTYLATATLVAAAVSASAQVSTNNALSYNSIHAYYAGSNSQDSFGVAAQAQLGASNFFVDAGFESNSGKSSLAGYNDRQASIDIGYKLSVGPGDVNLTVGYVQDKESLAAFPDASSGVTFGLGWRQKINQTLEYGLSYVHTSGTISSNGANASNDDDAFTLEVRYYFAPKFDLSLGYTADKFSGSSTASTWFIGVGYNF